MVRDVFDQSKLEQLVGNMGVGHGECLLTILLLPHLTNHDLLWSLEAVFSYDMRLTNRSRMEIFLTLEL